MDIKAALKKVGNAINPFDDLAEFLEKWLEIAKREMGIFVLQLMKRVSSKGIDAECADLQAEIDELKGK